MVKKIENPYISALMQSDMYRAAKMAVIEQDPNKDSENAIEEAMYTTNRIFCFFYIGEKYGLDDETRELILHTTSISDSSDSKEKKRLLRNWESKIDYLKSIGVPQEALAGIYEFMAQVTKDRIEVLSYLFESIKLWPDNDNVYGQLSDFCNFVLRNSLASGEWAEEMTMAQNIQDTLIELRSGNATGIKEEMERIEEEFMSAAKPIFDFFSEIKSLTEDSDKPSQETKRNKQIPKTDDKPTLH